MDLENRANQVADICAPMDPSEFIVVDELISWERN